MNVPFNLRLRSSMTFETGGGDDQVLAQTSGQGGARSGHWFIMWAAKCSTLKQADAHCCPQTSLHFHSCSSLSHDESQTQKRRTGCKEKKELTQSQTPCDKRGTCCSLGQRMRGRRRSHWQSVRSASTVYGPVYLKVHPRRRLRTSSPNTQCYLETGIETQRKSKTSWKIVLRTGQLCFFSVKHTVTIPNLIIAGPGDCTISIIFERMTTPLLLFWSMLNPEGNTWLFRS